MDKYSTEGALTQTLIQFIETEKPSNIQQLVDLAKVATSIPEQKVIEHVLQLQNQGKIKFLELSARSPQKLGAYLKMKEALWYWTTLILTVAAALTVFTIPEDAYPLVNIRYILGTALVMWLPGYSFTKTLFPTKALDRIERGALSIGLSIALVSLVGLILNYTPWGIRLTSIMVGLFLVTTLLATVAVIREHQAKLRAP